jgi:radical SAM family uncharacterized protein/radical SAM-linked protein
LLTDELLELVTKPGQYLGNEWGAYRRPWESADVHLAFAFPDLYELGMSNFGQRILYQIVNELPNLMADRTYAPNSDMETILRERGVPLWGWESRRPLKDFELIGFSLQYELTYTNVLNMLDLSGIPVFSHEREELFPLIFGGGPSSVNPEPLAHFFDFFLIGDGEAVVPQLMGIVREFKQTVDQSLPVKELRQQLLLKLAKEVPGIYVPSLYEQVEESPVVKPRFPGLPERVMRQVQPLNDANQPTKGLVPYLSLVHDRQVLEVRRGCDRGCRFCQPGYTFLPVRERSTEDLLRLSKEGLDQSGHSEYSLLSLCVSDYTSLTESVRALNSEHSQRRASMSFPSQRADRMNLDIAEELKAVRKSGITLAPEAGTERLRAVINKGLNHQQIISAIESAYQSGWASVKLYFMMGLPTETDEDLDGIVQILKEATDRCRSIRKTDPAKYKRTIEFTCTLSNTVPKPHTPFQWFGQIDRDETVRRQKVLRAKLKESRLMNVQLNFTDPTISMLEAVISRGDRQIGDIIYKAWRKGCTFDAWDDRFQPKLWDEAAAELGVSLEAMASTPREVGSPQPWDIVTIGLHTWWLVREWEKAMKVQETAPCTENTCHACGVCTELDTTHQLAAPKPEVMKKNPFVKELAQYKTEEDDSHPSLFFMAPPETPSNKSVTRLRFEITKLGELRFISHLDLQHLLARAARRAQLKVAFTEGFNPSPKLSLAVSLPLFQESTAEVGELELAEAMEPEEFVRRINAQLPMEVQLRRAKIIANSGPSLASIVGKAKYRAEAVSLTAGGQAIESQEIVRSKIEATLAEILSRPSVEVAYPNREQGRADTIKDIRSGIHSLRLAEDGQRLAVELELAAGSKLHVKPSDVLSLLDHPNLNWRITRLELATSDGVPLFDLP